MRSRRAIEREPRARDHRSSNDDDSTASKLLVMQTPSHEELFRDDGSELLLSAASRFLCEDSSSSASAFAFAPIDDFPSFQALLQAATSVVTVDSTAAAAAAAAALQPTKALAARAHTQKRRERNRISCRKTRLKRKVEQASEDLLASRRAERNRFLSELHHELSRLEHDQQQQHSGSRKLARTQMAHEFVTRSLHFQLMDPEYDAAWCFESTAEPVSRRGRGGANDTLLEQWQSIVADLENANLEILQMDEVGSQSQCVVSCQWRLVGLSKQQLQSGRVEKVVVSGVTEVRFHGRSIKSIDMRVV